MINQSPEIIILKDPHAVAEYTADKFIQISAEAEKHKSIKHISLSGGSTPSLLFKRLASDNYLKHINWQNIHIWWGDERTVLEEDPESNYGKTHTLLLSKIDIPNENIHRIKVEFKPEKAAAEYQEEVMDNIPKLIGIPVFDWTILGMGEDGHTASIFKIDDNFCTENLTDVTIHPQSGQKRITLTAKTLRASKRITFLVTGEKKSKRIKEILGKINLINDYPASLIRSESGITEWVLDEKAGELL